MAEIYQALYRKWRPRTFDDVVGQRHITEILKSQVAADKPSHAYLFTGSRGTGKTTCAKILSRAINCENPVEGNPCNACPACLGIENGTIMDVVEMDAASNNSVDDIRTLRDEAIYSPNDVRRRVYIMDEVHMLSPAAFNALLKIIEEPPEHLVFILATTELEKIPATILSRCQRFAFRRILPEDIVDQLNFVAAQEGIDLTPDGSALLARLADGALRDALTLLDQCAKAEDTVDRQAVYDILGLTGNVQTAHMMNYVKQRKTGEVLQLLDELFDKGKDMKSLLDELALLSRDLLVIQTAANEGYSLVRGGYDDQTLRVLAKEFPTKRLLWISSELQACLGRLRISSDPRMEAEVCLIRICTQETPQDDQPAKPVRTTSVTRDDSDLSNRLDRVEQQLHQTVQTTTGSDRQVLQKLLQVLRQLDEQMRRGEGNVRQQDSVPASRVASRIVQASGVQDTQSAEQDNSRPEVPAGTWEKIAAEVKSLVSGPASIYINMPDRCTGVFEGNQLILLVNDMTIKHVMEDEDLQLQLSQVAAARLGYPVHIKIQLKSQERVSNGASQASTENTGFTELLDLLEQSVNTTYVEE